MKYLKSKKISKKKYLLTIEVSDYDLEMLEDFATTMAPFELYDKHKEEIGFDFTPCEFNDKYQRWLLKTWKIFWRHINDEQKTK